MKIVSNDGVVAYLDTGANIRDLSQGAQMLITREAERMRENAPRSGRSPTYASAAGSRGYIPNNVSFGSGIGQGTDQSDHSLAPDTPYQGPLVSQTLFSNTSSDGLGSANQSATAAPSPTLHQQQLDR